MTDTFNFLQSAFNNNPELVRTVTNWNDISYVLPLIYTDVRMYACNVDMDNVVELGTRGGESTVALYSAVLEANERLNQNCKLTSIDIDPNCCRVEDRLANIGTTEHWRFICDDSVKVDWHQPVDFLLIDSSHTYEQTLLELNRWSRWIKVGGTIWLHDVKSTAEVPQAIKEWRTENPTWEYYEVPTYAGLAWLKKTC